MKKKRIELTGTEGVIISHFRLSYTNMATYDRDMTLQTKDNSLPTS